VVLVCIFLGGKGDRPELLCKDRQTIEEEYREYKSPEEL